MRRCVWHFLAVVVVLTTLAPAGLRAAEGKYPAMTDLSQVDEDFAYQGEYSGDIVVGKDKTVRIGLQVVALGKGTFQATEFPGGLPGDGWNGHGKVELLGKLVNRAVHLEGYPLEIEVHPTFASVHFTGGKEVGSLAKVERVSPTMGESAPCGYRATVLFDGTNTDHFKNAQMSEDGLLMVGTETKDSYANFKLHVEFRTPYMPEARGQARGNSGVYLQSRYEVQVLDSFGLEGLDNEAGGLYKLKAPDVNMALPPLTWQTYDIEFHAAQFDESGRKVKDATLTVVHNGVTIHENVKLTHKTGGGAPEGPEALPIKLQNHGNPVHYRNIWIVDYDAEAPCCCQTYKKGRRCCTVCGPCEDCDKDCNPCCD